MKTLRYILITGVLAGLLIVASGCQETSARVNPQQGQQIQIQTEPRPSQTDIRAEAYR